MEQAISSIHRNGFSICLTLSPRYLRLASPCDAYAVLVGLLDFAGGRSFAQRSGPTVQAPTDITQKKFRPSPSATVTSKLCQRESHTPRRFKSMQRREKLNITGKIYAITCLQIIVVSCPQSLVRTEVQSTSQFVRLMQGGSPVGRVTRSTLTLGLDRPAIGLPNADSPA